MFAALAAAAVQLGQLGLLGVGGDVRRVGWVGHVRLSQVGVFRVVIPGLTDQFRMGRVDQIALRVGGFAILGG